METGRFHTPVLLGEALALLAPVPGGTYVDATLGGGGHARAILQQSAPDGRCIGIDADADALNEASRELGGFGTRFLPVHGNFGMLDAILRRCSVREADGILFDLGVSSHQLDEPERGFSFRADEPLDMRMDRTQALNAEQILNTMSADQLASLIRRFGEERQARRIARLLTEERSRRPLRTTGDLAAVVRRAVGPRSAVKSLARVFQAVRIEVNRELDRLAAGLDQSLEVLRPGGRIVVISYHSLEDRIVKDMFREASRSTRPSGTALLPDVAVKPRLRVLTRKPVTASASEERSNPRSRSAKLRAAEKI